MIEHFEKLGRHTILYGIAKGASALSLLILVSILTRAFSPSEYGVIELALALVLVLGSFLMMGLDSAVAVHFYQAEGVEARKKILPTALYFLFASSAAILVSLSVFTESLSSLVFGAAGLEMAFLFALGAAFFVVFRNLFENVVRLHLQPLFYLAITFTQTALLIGLVLLFTFQFNWGVEGILGAYLLASLGAASVGFLLTFSDYLLSFSLVVFRSLVAFGFPLLFVALSEWVLHLADRLFLVYFTSPEQVGLYSLGLRISQVILLVVGSFQLAWVPFALSIHKEKDAPHTFAHILTYFTIATCGLALSLTVFAKEIISLIATPLYQEAFKVVGPLSLGLVAYGSYSILALGIMISRKTGYLAWTAGAAALLNIVLNFLLVPRFGMVGAALATVTSFFVSAILMYVISQRYYPIPFQIKKVGILWAITIVFMIAGIHIQFGSAFLTFAAKLIIPGGFLLALFLLKIVHLSEIGLFVQLLRRIAAGSLPSNSQ